MTVRFVGPTTHPLSDIITAYTTSLGTLSLLIRVWEMVEPDPLLYPETLPVAVAVQVKATPGRLAVRLITKGLPEQVDWEVGVTVRFGAGTTVTTTVILFPTQPFADGVIT